ncbi:AMP-dependent synthetase and ligase [Stigmatella aurantiaca DW4/3-1]|uniref:AMP-dependent synthetase and ligase n=2 Tax=Stigmatella aurantiaca TaxID=41 RepID=Q08XJ0_STIAD|nr:AMP-dependent synthetase and ligase [Stigmatella aurantiaca DW4/3-1]EAU65176.1 long-chain-fatty-acid--CoA ligase, putative [Stigmatella aurantiaca DW4/3-1]
MIRSFAQLREDVHQKVTELRHRGLDALMRVGVLACNCYEWIVLDLALVSLRCEIVALTSAQLHGDLEAIAVEQELSTVLLVGNGTPISRFAHLEWVVAENARGPIPLRVGSPRQADPEWTAPFRVFSSGSTGTPRCISVPRAGMEQCIEELKETYAFDASDTLLLFLPVANLQQRFLVYAALWYGISLVVIEPIHLLPALKETAPTILLAPPLFFETIARRVTGSLPLRWLIRMAARARTRRGRLLLWGRLALAPLRKRVFSELGGRVRLMITGMAPVGRATLEVYSALELPLFEAYGMTECGIIACNTPRTARSGSVGHPVAGVRVELLPDGEITVQRRVPLTSGYVGIDPEVCAETYLGQGKVATGDLGWFDDEGFLHLMGRKKNVIVLGDGRKIHPEPVERELISIPWVHQAALLPEGHSGLACVIHAAGQGSRFERAVRRELERIVWEHTGQGLGRVLFNKEPFTSQNGLLTQNLKLNRLALRRLLGSQGATAAWKWEESKNVIAPR